MLIAHSQRHRRNDLTITKDCKDFPVKSATPKFSSCPYARNSKSLILSTQPASIPALRSSPPGCWEGFCAQMVSFLWCTESVFWYLLYVFPQMKLKLKCIVVDPWYWRGDAPLSNTPLLLFQFVFNYFDCLSLVRWEKSIGELILWD